MFVSGALTAEEREQFELILEFDEELREFVAGLSEVGATLAMAAHTPATDSPSPALKSRISGLIAGRPQRSAAEGLVVAGPDGLVQWVNPAFTQMCGYTIEELRGKKLGPILQGAGTDRQTADRMRRAVHELRPCNETILNYHKNGNPYWVEIAITPIYTGGSQPHWLIARERELTARAA